LSRRLDMMDHSITIVDPNARHYYQPGFLFIPFGMYSERDVVRPKADFYPRGVSFVQKEVEVVEPKANRVRLKNGEDLSYDILVIATGSRIVPSETQGLLGKGWGRNIFDFYTLSGSQAKGSVNSISLATETPSCTTLGAPHFLSSATFRPLGPNVVITALARVLTP
jgi:sulfide:quinone oxidoreductase